MPSPSDLVPGQPVGPHVVDRVDSARMKTVAALLDDPVPLHFDIAKVESLGHGNRLINQGPLNVAYLMEMVSRFAGGHQKMRAFKVRLLGSVYEGDRVVCTGSVATVDAEAGTATLELEARVGETPVLTGSATIALGD